MVSRRLVLGFLLAATIPILCLAEEAEKPDNTGTITGTILKDGQPASSGRIVFFRKGSGLRPHPGSYLRPPDEMVKIGDGGVFAATLPAGEYYLSATVRTSGEIVGPPALGDHVYPSPSDLQEGKSLYTVTPGKTTDIGRVGVVPFEPNLTAIGEEVATITGTITDANGKPVSGALTLAFTSRDFIGRPAFVSERTGKDGTYVLRVVGGQTYYVKSRTFRVTSIDTGGYPAKDELIGVYGGDTPLPVVAPRGQVVPDVNIRSAPFAGRGQGNLSRYGDRIGRPE